MLDSRTIGFLILINKGHIFKNFFGSLVNLIAVLKQIEFKFIKCDIAL